MVVCVCVCVCVGGWVHVCEPPLQSCKWWEVGGRQSVGGVTVDRLGNSDGAILGGVGHSEGVALGIAG